MLVRQVHELERTRRTLETEAQNLRIQTQELEEELSEAENSRLRLEVTLQALKAQFEREISSNEEKGEEKRRALSKQVTMENEKGKCWCFWYVLFVQVNQIVYVLLLIPGEGVRDPAGGGEESAVSVCVIQEAAGSRTAGS